MKAYRISTGKTIAPFGDSVDQVRIFDKALCDIQEEALKKAGFSLVSQPPASEPYLLISDRIWFTFPLVERLKEHFGKKVEWLKHSLGKRG